MHISEKRKDRVMVTSETLGKLFPLEGEIPAEHKLAAPIHQRSWLVNGELRTWNDTCKAGQSGQVNTTLDIGRGNDGVVHDAATVSMPTWSSTSRWIRIRTS